MTNRVDALARQFYTPPLDHGRYVPLIDLNVRARASIEEAGEGVAVFSFAHGRKRARDDRAIRLLLERLLGLVFFEPALVRGIAPGYAFFVDLDGLPAFVRRVTPKKTADSVNVPRETHVAGMLFGLFAFALVVRLVASWRGMATPLVTDEHEHFDSAANVLNGIGYALVPQGSTTGVPELSAYRAPGGSLILAASMAVFGISPVVAKLTAITFASVSAPLMYLFARTSLPKPPALAAAAATCLWPTWVVYSSQVLSEPFFVPALLWVLLSATNVIDRRSKSWAISLGLAFAVTMLIKPAGFPLLLLVLLYTAFRFRREDVKVSLSLFAVVLTTCAVAYSPWVIRNEMVFHRLIPFATEGGETLLGANNQHVLDDPKVWGMWASPLATPEYKQALDGVHDDYERSKIQNSLAIRFLTEHPSLIPTLVFRKEARFFTPVTETGGATRIAVLGSYGTLLVLLIVGLATKRLHASTALQVSGLWLLTMTVLTAIFWGALTRGRLPLEVVFIPWGVETVWRFLRAAERPTK